MSFLVDPLPLERLATVVEEIALRGFAVVDHVIPLEALVRNEIRTDECWRSNSIASAVCLPTLACTDCCCVCLLQDLLTPMMLAQAAQLEARRAWELRAVRPRHGSRGEGIHGGNHRHLQQAPPRHAPWVNAGW